MVAVQGFTVAFKSYCRSTIAVSACCTSIAPVIAVTPFTAIAVTRTVRALFLHFCGVGFSVLNTTVQLQVGQRCDHCGGVSRLTGKWCCRVLHWRSRVAAFATPVAATVAAAFTTRGALAPAVAMGAAAFTAFAPWRPLILRAQIGHAVVAVRC